MKLLLILAISSALSVPFHGRQQETDLVKGESKLDEYEPYDDPDSEFADYDIFNGENKLNDYEQYDDHDYGTDSEFVDYDSDDSDLDIPESDVPVMDWTGLDVFVDLASCDANSILSVSSLELNPDPPKTGQNLTLTASGILNAPVIKGATLRVAVRLGFVPLYDQTDDLCDLTKQNGIECPIGKGKHSITAGFPVPAIAPKASIFSLGIFMSKFVVSHRLKIWNDQIRKRSRDQIKVTIGKESITAFKNVTRPMDLKHGFAAKVDNQLWDFGRPLENDCILQILTENDTTKNEYQSLLGNSGAVLLGSALEKAFPNVLLGWKSHDANPFFLDIAFTDLKYDKHLNLGELEDLTKIVQKLGQEGLPFERIDVEVDVAKEIFNYSPVISYMLSKMNGLVPLVKCGDFIDIYKGPVVANSGQVLGFKCLESSSTMLKTDSEQIKMNRIHAVAFPKADKLKKWLDERERGLKSDHRHIGKDQKLFYMHHLSPGSVFMLPHGVRIVNRLLDFLRSCYRKYGYHEVISPLLFNKSLWECSGHWQNYKEDMFLINQIEQASDKEIVENLEIGLKPMNCPGHCLIYGSESRSYRDLPLRYADFSPLHRNEDTGALTGLTRVRKFHQDDGHIFCRPDQIEVEIFATLEFLQNVYSILGFESLQICLSTRPDKYMGNLDEWSNAESSLISALNKRNLKFTVNEGDGAFYGPKIDILVRDSFGRNHQTATIQLDFQLPERFNLSFLNEKDKLERPVIIHRAILGSIERMMAILIEHYQGKWPFWLSPRQAIVISIRKEFNEYANEISKFLSMNGNFSGNIIKGISGMSNSEYYFVDSDISDKTLGKKIHDAQIQAYNYIVVVGKREYDTQSVTIRQRGEKGNEGIALSLVDALAYFKDRFNEPFK